MSAEVDRFSQAAEFEGRHRLFPALVLEFLTTLRDGTQTATVGGSLPIRIRNAGIAVARAPVIEVTRATFQLTAPGGTIVWEPRDDGTGFWRRGRRGERLAPNRQVVARDELAGVPGGLPPDDPRMRMPEDYIAAPNVPSEFSILESVATTPLPMMAPNSDVEISVAIKPLPAPEAETGVWSWCVLVRGFDLLGVPRPPLALPTPVQRTHHTTLVCLHESHGD